MLHRFRKAFVLLVSLCMVLGVSVFLAACGENTDPPTAVDQTTIQYDGYIITWAGADRATKYDLTINGNPYSSGGTSYAYPCESFPADVYSITITASNQYGSAEPTSKNFTRIPSIEKETITFSEEGEMSWMSVSGALSYEVEVNGAVNETATTTFSDFVYGGNNRIRIRPRGADGTFSIWSQTLSKTYLNSPSNVTYDNQFISWRGDTSAKGYNVYIDGAKHNLEPITDTKYLFDSASADFSVEVRAEGDGVDVFPSKKSEKIDYTYLGTAENVRVQEGVLTWENPKAVSFIVRVGGRDVVVTEPEYKLTAGSTQTIKILPQGKDNEHTFASWSEEKSYNVLVAPQPTWDNALRVDGEEEQTILTWNRVLGGGVSGYRIRFTTPDSENPQTRETQDSQPSFSYNFPVVGKYTVSVQTLALPNGDYYDSAYSAEFTIIRLAPPTVSGNAITSDPTDIHSGFTVRFGSVSGANGYLLYKDGTETSLTAQRDATTLAVTEGNLTLPTDNRVAQISYGLQSIGTAAVGNGKTVTLSSLRSQNTTFVIRVLPMPTDLECEGDFLKWTGTADAKAYSVLVEDRTEVTITQFDLRNIVTDGDHTVSVCAKGDGAALLPSSYTPEQKVNKLSAPAYLEVDPGSEGGRLSWTRSENVQSYNVYFDGSNTPERDVQQINIMDHISQGTTTVIVEAVGNWYGNTESHDVYYLTSNKSITYTFTKLSKPTFGGKPFTNTELTWNAPGNAQNTANIIYTLFDGSDVVDDGIDGTTYNIASFESGEHRIKVKAVCREIRCSGGSTAFVNSDESDEISFTKLEMPTVTKGERAYQWEGVSLAVSYSVMVEGKLAASIPAGSNISFSYIPVFNDLLKNDVEVNVIAVGNGEIGGTIDSNPFVIHQTVKKLETPKLNRPTFERDSNGGAGTITATLKEVVPNATGYRLSINGVVQPGEYNGSKTTFTARTSNTGTMVATVVALGSVFDGDGVFYINSDVAGSSTTTQIILLDTPAAGGITKRPDGTISWDSAKVENCTKYRLEITYSGESPIIIEPGNMSNTLSFKASGDKVGNRDPGNIRCVRLQAVGDSIEGGYKYDSEWSQPKYFS